MPEFKLKNGEKITALLVDREDENYVYLLHATKTNLDGSTTYFYRYWVRKDEIESEDATGKATSEEVVADPPTTKAGEQAVETAIKTEEQAATAAIIEKPATEAEAAPGVEAMAPRRRRRRQ